MKKILVAVLLVGLIAIIPRGAYADSPVTSTPFSEAYMDVEIVKQAKAEGIITPLIAEYLKAAGNPVDVKAAVINALSWDADGKNNADTFSNILYNKPVDQLEVENLSGDELFCLGYLLLMDDYFSPERAVPYLEKAKEKKTDSFTVSVILAIARAQSVMSESWVLTEQALNDKSLVMDMRQEAVKIIADYMVLYKGSSEGLPPGAGEPAYIDVFAGNNNITVKLNGSLLTSDVPPVIVNGRVLIPVRAVFETLGAKVTWDPFLKQVKAQKENVLLLLKVDSNMAYLNGYLVDLDVPATMKNSRVLVPLRFVGESLGCKVNYYPNWK